MEPETNSVIDHDIETLRNDQNESPIVKTDRTDIDKSTSSPVLETSTNADELECITSKQSES